MADYSLEGPRWLSNAITWSFATANYVGQAAYAAITQTFYAVGQVFQNDVIWAFQRWSQVSNLQFTQVADSSNVGIRLGWTVIDGFGGTAGIASYGYDGSNYFLPDNVIEFDSGDTWVLGSDGDYHAGSAFGTSFRAIALHEIGHALGLGHYNGDTAIMNSSISASLNDLTQHDINGC